MIEPKATRPYWPDALGTPKDATTGLKSWSWTLERLEQSHNYWVATTRPDRRPHLMLVWGVWWEDAFWFSTGRQTRKVKNLAVEPHCVIGTEKADEAVILEGIAEEIRDRAGWQPIVKVYNCKYEEDLGPLLEKSGSCVIRVRPQVIFAQDEHAENFVEGVTRWRFPQTPG